MTKLEPTRTKLEPTRTSSDLTATDRLRELLDDRGVEHYDYRAEVWWGGESSGGGGAKYTAYEQTDGLICVEIADLTPEQAIAATLGTGACHDKGTFKSWGLFTCSNCSIVIPLNAAKDAPEIGKVVPLRFCPNCGRKVVDE